MISALQVQHAMSAPPLTHVMVILQRALMSPPSRKGTMGPITPVR